MPHKSLPSNSFFTPAQKLARTAACVLVAFGVLAGTAHAAGKTLVFC
jgi:dipeptide transport system substrate-binding protein